MDRMALLVADVSLLMGALPCLPSASSRTCRAASAPTHPWPSSWPWVSHMLNVVSYLSEEVFSHPMPPCLAAASAHALHAMNCAPCQVAWT